VGFTEAITNSNTLLDIGKSDGPKESKQRAG